MGGLPCDVFFEDFLRSLRLIKIFWLNGSFDDHLFLHMMLYLWGTTVLIDDLVLLNLKGVFVIEFFLVTEIFFRDKALLGVKINKILS